MKLPAILKPSLFVLIAAITVNAGAATDAPSDTPAAKAEPQKKAKAHSHVEEKSGVAPKAMEAATGGADPAKDKSKHRHQRDSK